MPQETVDKRKRQFAPILCIPAEYFDAFYSKQIEDFRKWGDLHRSLILVKYRLK